MASSNLRGSALFQRLKPLCVTLSDHALRVNANTSPQALQNALQAVHSELTSLPDPTLLTPALADYIFFPLSHILRRKELWSDRVLDLTLQCVNILLSTGWSTNLAPNLFEQFCLMLVVITEKSHAEDVKYPAVCCLVALFRAAKTSMLRDEVLREAVRGNKLRPLLGHVATVLLDIIKLEGLLKLRIEAVEALHLLYIELLYNGQSLAGFLPLTVSTISRALSSAPTTNRTLLVGLLDLLRETLSRVMNDNLEPVPVVGGPMYQVNMTDQWYRATKSQAKIALEAFFPLMRSHTNHRVREAVIALCEQLVEQCSRHLDVCLPLLIESILSREHDAFPSTRERAQEAVRRIHGESSLQRTVHDTIEECLRTWCTSLPRTMTSNDDVAKLDLLQRITSAINFFASDIQMVSSSMEMLLSAVRDTTVFQEESTRRKVIESTLQLTFQGETPATGLVLAYSKEGSVSRALEGLLQAVGRTSLAPQILDKVILEAASTQSPSDAWIGLQILKGHGSSAHLDELYSVATDWLTAADSSYSTEEIASPAILISLDILSYTASIQKLSFRNNLLNLLYPILSLLSHPSPTIQATARDTLAAIAHHTDYSSPSSLVLANTDYLVNSVSLKLHVFDVSPQVLATLYTVTKLAGPEIVPYLDDVWRGLFDVVDRFARYERLVTGVFAVMGGIVEVLNQRTKVPARIEAGTKSEEDDLQDLITELQRDELQEDTMSTTLATPSLPSLPKKTASLLESVARKAVLLSTHPSPNLRFNLLLLLRKSLPLLSLPTQKSSPDEQDPFLPLVAQEIFPAISTKLSDPESFVVNAALDALAELFAFEGEFLGSKVERDIWPQLKRILRKKAENKEMAIKALIAILRHANLKPALFDEILMTAWPLLPSHESLRTAFDDKNPDAVWLLDYLHSHESTHK
jgi:TELO2-interacting protein 1